MGFHLRRGTAADVPAMVDIYFSAFAHSQIVRECFPFSSPEVQTWWSNALAEEIADPHSHFLVITHLDPSAPSSPSHATVVAFAKWMSPVDATHDWTQLPAFPVDGNPKLAAEFFGSLARKHAEIMADKQHWYLELVAVRKEWQGKGASSPLLRWGVEQADGDRMPCFLESFEASKPVYERYGFSSVDSLSFFDGTTIEYFMIRQAREN